MLNELFTFSEILVEGNIITANVKLDSSHEIFKGHFPGEPVLPGVCQAQMVKELLEIHLKRQLRLIKANDIKFLSIINPDDNKLIRIELKVTYQEDASIRVEARLQDDSGPLFKFKGIFKDKS
jgi:3-hydroxyacyl-[acyl-carrier-protein] dehydratase